MLEEFVELIPDSFLNQPGSALDSGRQAFAVQPDIYIIGYHSGGQSPELLEEQIDRVLHREDANWCAYKDEVWGRPPPGSHRIQKRIVHLCAGLGLDPRAVPASYLIFRRWDAANEPSAAVKREWAEKCWPFHQKVIDRLDVKIVVCLGRPASDWVLKKERGRIEREPQQIDSFTAQNKWKWSSYAYQSGDRYIVTLLHPSMANWINPNADPTELVRRTLAKVRG